VYTNCNTRTVSN